MPPTHMQLREKTIISSVTLISSLLFYWYAKSAAKADASPYVLVGGFVGSVIGELVAEKTKRN